MSAKHIAMTAEVREGTGKGTARALRREKKIPAVIYGNNQSPVSIVLDEKNITLEYHKGHLFTTLVDINVNGKKELVLARDIQTHVVTDAVIHADFLRVSEKTKIAVRVPVHFEGHEKSPALKAKAILNVVRHEVELMCMATDIPETLTVNLAGKDFGDSVRISDAVMPQGVTPVITDRDFTIATIVEPKGGLDDLDEEDTGAPEASEVPSEKGGDKEEE
jgi:large subunit ribosomal protein L25